MNLIDKIAEQGRGGDTELRIVDGEVSHVNKEEAQVIDKFGPIGQMAVRQIGSGTINPTTGLREYIIGVGPISQIIIGTMLSRIASDATGLTPKADKKMGSQMLGSAGRAWDTTFGKEGLAGWAWDLIGGETASEKRKRTKQLRSIDKYKGGLQEGLDGVTAHHSAMFNINDTSRGLETSKDLSKINNMGNVATSNPTRSILDSVINKNITAHNKELLTSLHGIKLEKESYAQRIFDADQSKRIINQT